MADRWHSVDEVSAHLGIVPETVYRWLAAGRLPGHRIGRLWKFKLDEVDDWIRQGRTVEEPPAQVVTPAQSAR